MKNYVILTLIIVFTILISGCQSEEEKKAEQERILEEQITTLTQSAEEYYKKGDILNALEIYEEIVKLKPSKENLDKQSTLSLEIENAKKTKLFLDGLYDIEKNKLRSGISVTASDFEYAMKDLVILINDFEKINYSDNNSINTFISSIKNDTAYKSYSYLKDQASNEIFENGGMTDAVSTLDPYYDNFTTGVYAFYRDGILESIQNILSKPFPKKYDNVINN